MEIDSQKKYYKAIRDSFLWKEGAILVADNVDRPTDEPSDEDEGYYGFGYQAIEDIWDTTKFNESEYISARIIENCPEWFERVYPVKHDGKVSFATKEEAKSVYKGKFEPIIVK